MRILGPLALLLALVAAPLGSARAADDASAQAVVDALGPAMAALGRKDYPAAEKGLRVVLALVETSDGPASEAAGQVAGALANAIDNQGRHAEAEPLYRRALAVLPAGATEQAIYRDALANNLEGQGRFGEAEPLLRELVARRRGEGVAGTAGLASALDSLGYVLTELGRAREAEAPLREALGLATKAAGAPSEPVARAETDLGGAIDEQGRAVEAEAHFRRALAIRQTLGREAGDQAPGNTLALSYNNVASALEDQGRIDEAEPLFQRALDTWLAVTPPEPRQVAVGYANLAQIRFARLDYTGAEALLRKALALDRAALGSEHIDTATRELQLGAALREQLRFTEAEPLIVHALAVRERALGAGHPMSGRAAATLAQLRLDRGDTAGAIAGFRRALEVQRRALGERHPYVAAAWSNLADAELHDPARAAAALDDARQGVAIARAIRSRREAGREGGGNRAARSLGGALSRNARREDGAERGYSILVDAAWASAHAGSGRGDRGDRAPLAEAFLAAQDMQRSAAAEAVAQAAARALAPSGELGALAGREQDLVAEARRIDARLLDSALETDPQAPALRARLDALGQALADNERALRQRFPDYTRLTDPAALPLVDVQARLGPDRALLLVAPSNYDTYVFAITATGADWIKAKDDARDVVRQVGRLRCEADPVTCRSADADTREPTPFEQKGFRHYDRDAAWALYRDLIAPLAPTIGARHELLVVTSGPLADLPLGMLLTAPPGPGDDADPALQRDAPWLADRYAITTLPGVPVLRALRGARAQPADGIAFVGFGAPELLGRAGALVAAMRAGAPMFRSFDEDGTPLADPAFLRALEPLPGTRVELDAMAQTLAAPKDTLMLGKAATETAVRTDPRVARARVLAFATHGALPGEANGFEQPGLVLTPPTVPSARDDGFLAASEAAGLRLSADWVVLSACNTASAEGRGGADSLSALASAFLYAGAHSLLASHWRVEDDVTAAITVETLRAWRAHPDRSHAAALAEALHAVRTGSRADGSKLDHWASEWSHPGSWAPFSLIAAGD